MTHVSDGPPRILVFGRSGQVAQSLAALEPALGEVRHLGRAEADLESPSALRTAIESWRPGIVIIAAAYTAVDRAESEPAVAERVNAQAPGIIAEAADRLGAIVVHYSTDYVFDGSGTRPWHEADTPRPLSVYGRTKLAGESGVRMARRHLIFRTSWVVSPVGRNFVRTILRLAAERPTLEVVDDQHGAPTTAARIATITAHVLRTMASASPDDPRWGTYHLTSAGETTWHGVARSVVARAAARGVLLRASPESVRPIRTADHPTPAIRPLDSRLSTHALRQTFGVELPDWSAEVAATVDLLCPSPAP